MEKGGGTEKKTNHLVYILVLRTTAVGWGYKCCQKNSIWAKKRKL